MSTSTLSLFSLIISVLVVILLGTDIGNVQLVQAGNPNYGDALAKSILFFQGQRSGKLPSGPAQQITWRSNSGLSDGRLAQVNRYICFCFFDSYLLKYVLLKEKMTLKNLWNSGGLNWRILWCWRQCQIQLSDGLHHHNAIMGSTWIWQENGGPAAKYPGCNPMVRKLPSKVCASHAR